MNWRLLYQSEAGWRIKNDRRVTSKGRGGREDDKRDGRKKHRGEHDGTYMNQGGQVASMNGMRLAVYMLCQPTLP